MLIIHVRLYTKDIILCLLSVWDTKKGDNSLLVQSLKCRKVTQLSQKDKNIRKLKLNI